MFTTDNFKVNNLTLLFQSEYPIHWVFLPFYNVWQHLIQQIKQALCMWHLSDGWVTSEWFQNA